MECNNTAGQTTQSSEKAVAFIFRVSLTAGISQASICGGSKAWVHWTWMNTSHQSANSSDPASWIKRDNNAFLLCTIKLNSCTWLNVSNFSTRQRRQWWVASSVSLLPPIIDSIKAIKDLLWKIPWDSRDNYRALRAKERKVKEANTIPNVRNNITQCKLCMRMQQGVAHK